jgi:ParB family chromosome partitioning protein
MLNLDLSTFADDLTGENENEQRTAEEVLLSAFETLSEDKLTAFAIRLAIAGHRGIPREDEFNFLAEPKTRLHTTSQGSKAQEAKTITPTAVDSEPVPKAQSTKP